MKPSAEAIRSQVNAALDEDIGPEDVSAALIDPASVTSAQLVCRQAGTLAGRDWAQTAFLLLDPNCRLDWSADDGDEIAAGQVLCRLQGRASALLSAERTALNFLQLLSGVATRTSAHVEVLAGTSARLLDTRKTVPGLRLAQKYAVTCGGGHNHRLGLHDMVMLKENHITAAGSITEAVQRARKRYPTLTVEVEVENLDELIEAIEVGADRVMLDNFELEQMREAVRVNSGRVVLEASGGLDLRGLRAVAETGVDDISVGGLTKAIVPLDLSLLFDPIE